MLEVVRHGITFVRALPCAAPIQIIVSTSSPLRAGALQDREVGAASDFHPHCDQEASVLEVQITAVATQHECALHSGCAARSLNQLEDRVVLRQIYCGHILACVVRRGVTGILLAAPVLLLAGSACAKDLEQAAKEKEARKQALKDKAKKAQVRSRPKRAYAVAAQRG